MNTWNAGQILTAVRTINRMDVDYLGPDETTQNQMLIQFMNTALWKLARLCYNTETSDTLTITADGPAAFLKNSTAITNMFEPLRVVEVDGSGNELDQAPRRYSSSAPKGWYCEGPGRPIHVRGLTGTFRLEYIRYPRQVTQASDPVDVPESGYDALINAISAQVKSVKNFYEESNAMDAKAQAGYPAITQAAISARGPSANGSPPAFGDVDKARGG